MSDILDDLDQNSSITTDEKVRHGCVTAWLIFSMVVNSITALSYILFGDAIADAIPGGGAEPWMLIALAVIGMINVVSCVLLFKWKKIGFFIFIGTSLITLGINLAMGINIMQCGMGLFGVFLLYVVLQIKEKNVTAWDQMD
jgi:hypothetical protein